jgi:hypothetical protein
MYCINFILLCIILSNIILQSIKSKEDFVSPIVQTGSKHIQAKMRPCTIQLTNDDDICDKLSDIYELSDSQLQVLLNTMKTNNAEQTAYNMLQYIKSVKHTIPMNSCKIQLSQWKEIQEVYTSTSNMLYPYKFITKNNEYNTSNLLGYCFYDVSDAATNNAHIDYLEDISNPSTTQLYSLKKLNNMSDAQSIKDLYCSAQPKSSFVPLDSMLNFMRLHAYVGENNIIKINNIDVVSYDMILNRFQPNTSYDVSKFFEFQYNQKQIFLGFSKISLSIYTFSFDICQRIKQYTISNSIDFSFQEFPNMLPKIVENNIVLPQKDTNIQANINTKINDIIQHHNSIKDQIQVYDDSIVEIVKNYEQLQSMECRDEKCKVQQQYLLSKHDILKSEKAHLEIELLRQKEEHILYAELNTKLQSTFFTFDEINKMLTTFGVPISYDKYAFLISNDDYIYLQI